MTIVVEKYDTVFVGSDVWGSMDEIAISVPSLGGDKGHRFLDLPAMDRVMLDIFISALTEIRDKKWPAEKTAEGGDDYSYVTLSGI